MRSDFAILALIESGRLRVDAEAGLAFAPRSNTPDKPIGALTRKGYLRACINIGGEQAHFMVHRIVWVSVHGPVAPGHQIDHLDTNKTHNRIGNLEAVPQLVNTARAKQAGLCRGNGRKDITRDPKGRFAKKPDGRLLDGRTWDEMPEARSG